MCSLRKQLRVTCRRTTSKQVTGILASLKDSKDVTEAGDRVKQNYSTAEADCGP